jgi:L-ascorbate metabolism protein UlaG (beta-lactamase superfamily)
MISNCKEEHAPMRITWYGHAAFLLEGADAAANAVRIILDPYRAPDVGSYAPIGDWADVVAVSHANERYHSHVDGIRGRPASIGRSSPTLPPRVVDGLALLREPDPRILAHGVAFRAVPVWEDETRQEPIAMIHVTVGGVRVLHMGDCGHALDAADVAACGPVDVLLALAGGPPTLAVPDLADFIVRLAPRVVIPMHFGNDKINLNLRPVTDLLAALPNTASRFLDEATVEVLPETLPGRTEIWVLPPAR